MTVSAHGYIIIEWCIVGATIAIVLLRLAVRSWKKQWSFWLSEIFMVLALLFFIALVIGDTYTFALGFDDLDGYYNEGYAIWKFSADVIFDTGFFFPRFSLLAFYNELFPISEDKLRIALYAVAAYTACAFVCVAGVDIFWCGTNVSLNWTEPDATCVIGVDMTPIYINWAVGISSELLVFALPFGLLHRLKALGKKEKVALTCIFLLGTATLLVSLTRFILNTQAAFGYGTYLLGDMEISTQIFVVALPALRPLLAKIRSRASSLRGYAKGRSAGDSQSSRGSKNSDDSRSIGLVSFQLSQPGSAESAGEAMRTPIDERIHVREHLSDKPSEPWDAIQLPSHIV